ncbi:MAG: hypothetical protein HY712_05730 [candidate division NC10 bacterium]|nr:hypothetical protein [candidate division NC10 bacterium]
MIRQLAWLSILLSLVPAARASAAEGFALLNRKHVGRVKAVEASGNRLVIEGLFHDRRFREIPVSLEPDAPIINPDIMNPTRVVGREAVRPGDYVVLECGETGKRHIARNVTIASTEVEEKLQRGLYKAGRAAPPGLRGTGGGPR